jgi:hypothetical protein
MAGEQTADAIKSEIYESQSFSVDDLGDDAPVDDTDSPEQTDSTDEPEIEVEGKTKSTVETEDSEAASLRKEIATLKDEVLKLATARKEKVPEQLKPEPEKTEKLTRAQISKIMAEHKDDPEVLLNVIDYMAEQKANEIKDSTVKDMNYNQWRSQLSGVANKIISEDEDGYLAANPKVVGQLDEMSTNLGLSDHPIGKLAAYAIFRLSEMSKAKTKEDDKSSAATKPVNTRVMDKTRASSQASKSQGLNQEQLAVAKKFGVKPETYAKFIRRS